VQAKVYRCLLDIASGLAFLHQKGILHGDLKLGNILLKSTTSDIRGTCRGLPSLVSDRATTSSIVLAVQHGRMHDRCTDICLEQASPARSATLA
jgi:serine/threonine protein kinase